MPQEESLNPKPPYNLKCWKLDTPRGTAHFYTCGRPGRENGPNGKVPDELVHQWVLGLPEPDTAIISLLGRKRPTKNEPIGKSEFWYYSFYGGWDTQSEREGCLSFQEWLNLHHKNLKISVYEYPTIDRMGVPLEVRCTVSNKLRRLILQGQTVVVVDSAGAERTGRIRDHIGAKKR